jgi:serine/threonine protein phosphatase PrpC
MLGNDQAKSYFAVFDGHFGHAAAEVTPVPQSTQQRGRTHCAQFVCLTATVLCILQSCKDQLHREIVRR